jgi:hypothetical protein
MNRCPDLPMTTKNLSEFTDVDPALLSTYTWSPPVLFYSNRGRSNYETSRRHGSRSGMWPRWVLAQQTIQNIVIGQVCGWIPLHVSTSPWL